MLLTPEQLALKAAKPPPSQLPAQLGALCEGLGLLHSAADGEAKGKAIAVLSHQRRGTLILAFSGVRLPNGLLMNY